MKEESERQQEVKLRVQGNKTYKYSESSWGHGDRTVTVWCSTVHSSHMQNSNRFKTGQQD